MTHTFEKTEKLLKKIIINYKWKTDQKHFFIFKYKKKTETTKLYLKVDDYIKKSLKNT